MLGRSLLNRAAWSVTSQAVSSISNFLLTLAVLSVAEPLEFAVFAVVITTYSLVLQLSRAASAVPLTMLYSGSADKAKAPGVPAAVGASVLVGLVASAVLVLGGTVTGASPQLFVILGLAMPFLLFQDSARHVSFARAEPRLAALSDGLWLAVQVGGSAVAIATGWADVGRLLLIWAAGGAAAGLLISIPLHLRPSLSGSLHWMRRHKDLCTKLVSEFLVNSGSFYLLLYGLALISGVGELGRLRAAQTLIGPVLVLILAGNALGIPESVRMRSDWRSLRKLCLAISATLMLAAALCGIAVYWLLPEFGPRFFSSSWQTARPLIPLIALFAAAVGASVGAGAGLRAFGEVAWILRARTVTSALTLLLGFPLSGFFGAEGALTTLMAMEFVFAGASWLRLQAGFPGEPDGTGELQPGIVL